MTWRLARGLEKLRAQVNAKWPNRSKNSDGSIGDEAHASRSSDHNPWIKDNGVGVVTAIDITHDPRGGFNSYDFADMLKRHKDNRIKYVISNRRIFSGNDGPRPWEWRRYTGSNPHDHHVHISIQSDRAHYDDVSDWNIEGVADPWPQMVDDYVKPRPTLSRGMQSEYVKVLQAAIGANPDGHFGPETFEKLKKWQADHHLMADGICGAQTWKTIP